ncbi:MAG: serine hydrolase [Alphaproteobacteria bacterium]|nr:serine hydrolase [Alphaproteobacteria bacterium]
MIDAALTGVWAASRPAVFDVRWVPAAPAITEHFFLVVSKHADGSLEAFIRNPEHNAGAFFRTRSVTIDGSRIILTAPKRDDAVGVGNADGTLTLSKIDEGGRDIRFHRASESDLRWFYPSAATSWTYQHPPNTGDGWRTATLRSVGMSEAPIASLIDAVVQSRAPSLKSPYVHSIAIERHGSLVLDQYFYGFSADQPHDVRSAGKSVTTLMVGRAIADTRAFSPASPVLSVLPQYSSVENDDSRKRQMTVANLMTMASGLACDDNDDSSPGNEDTMQSRPAGTDWYRYTLDLPMLSNPGTRALYCSAGINLLGAIVQTETRVSLDRYFDDRFAAPMQFGRYAMWLMPPPAGAAYMGGGDYFRPRDFLKFGELILRKGRWYGRRIVDETWIAQSVRPRTAPKGEGDLYGYGWHLLSILVDGQRYDVINAGGNGGQLLIVVPKLDVAIMVTAGNYNQFPVWRRFLPDVTAAVVRSCVQSGVSRRS